MTTIHNTHTTASGNTLAVEGCSLRISRPGKPDTTMLLRKTTAPPREFAAHYRKDGRDPANYRTLGNSVGFVLADADWIDAQYAAYDAAVQAERNRPATRERAEIEGIFNRAESKRDYPGEYFNLLHRAESTLAAWRVKYPADAAAEDARDRKHRADDLRRTAQGALLYDADGSIGPDEQQRRHDRMVVEADGIEIGK